MEQKHHILFAHNLMMRGKMVDKLKENVNKKGFHFPCQFETMSVETAFDYLEASRDGHGYLFEPDNYYGFMSLLVLKCGIDIDYVFSSEFIEDIEEVKKHTKISNMTLEELQKEVGKRIEECSQRMARRYAIMNAIDRYNNLNIIERISQILVGNKLNDGSFEKKTTKEINELYISKKQKIIVNRK